MASAKIPQLERCVKHFSPHFLKSVSAQVIRMLDKERACASVQLFLHPHLFAWAVVKEGFKSLWISECCGSHIITPLAKQGVVIHGTSF